MVVGAAVRAWSTGTIFALTYSALAWGRLPGLRIDRAGIALVGATLMLVTGCLALPEAARAVDYPTLILLFGMMVVVVHLRLSGFFERLVVWSLTQAHRPFSLLVVTVVLAGLLSAFLVNDVVCLALTPLVLHLTRRRGLPPVPYLVALATASNVGSAATITGNPQNMIIGSISHIPYLRFAACLAPVALAGLLVNFLVVACVYRSTLSVAAKPVAALGTPVRNHHRLRNHLLWKSVTVAAGAVALLLAGAPVALVALGAASVLLLGRTRPEHVYRRIDWSLLVMFTGLFVVVHGFDVNIVSRWPIAGWRPLRAHPLLTLGLGSAVLSNVVSNVPAVLVFKPLMPALPEREIAYLTLAMASTLAGNLTLLGSVANLIVVEAARRDGTVVSFAEYLRVGVPVTLLTLALGAAWLALVAS